MAIFKAMLCAAALALLSAPAAAQPSGMAVLGVQVKDTPAPVETVLAVTAQPTPDPAQTQDLFAEITQEERTVAGLGERILMRGMEGEDVALMQRRLYQLGYYLGEIDGVFGLGTRTAVYGFQRAHKLEKIDGKVGPETIARMFSDNVVIKPTPTPSPTPTPTPSPTPTATPKPTPAPSATPRPEGAPFALEQREIYIGGQKIAMTLGQDDEGSLLYPLCGVMGWLDYAHTYAAGSWELVRAQDGAQIALMTDGQDGLCAGAMGAYNGVIFLADDVNRVYVYGEEAYLTAGALGLFGVGVLEEADTAFIDG